MAIIVKVEADANDLTNTLQKAAEQAKTAFKDAFSQISTQLTAFRSRLSDAFEVKDVQGFIKHLGGLTQGGEQSAKALLGMTKSAGLAVTGVAALGVGAAAATAQILSMAREGSELADKMGEVAAKTGKSFEEIQKFEKGGRDLTERLKELGAVLGGDVIQQASRATDAFSVISEQLDALKIQMAAETEKGFDDLGRSIQNLVRDAKQGFQQLASAGGESMSILARGINQVRKEVAILLGVLSKIGTFGTLGLLDDNLDTLPTRSFSLNEGPPAPDALAFSRSNEALRKLIAPQFTSPTPKPKRTRSRKGQTPDLDLDIVEELQRVASRRGLVGDDLGTVVKEAKRVAEQVDIVRDQELVFERAGLTKRKEYLELKKKEVELSAAQDEVLAKQRELLRALPASQVTGQGLLAALPLTKTSGIAPSSKDKLPEFVVEVDDAVRATRALQRALDDADQSRQDLFDSIARNEHFLSTAFEPDPVRDYARALEDASRATASIVENQRFLNEAFNVKPLDLQAGLLDGIVRRMKSSTEILRDTALSSMDTIFDFVDRGFAKITQGMGAFRGVIAQLLSDISRLFLSKVFTQLLGAGGGASGGSGGFSINLGAGGGGASGGGFGGLLRGIISGNGGGGFGGFLTPPFNPNAGSQIAIPGSVSAGQSPVGLLNLGGVFGGTQIPGLGGGGAAAGGFSLGGLLGGLAPTFPLLGAGLGSALGGSSVPGKILGGIGGGILGATSAILATGSLFGLSIGLLTNPFTAIAGIGLLVGSALFGRAAQRKKDEKAADEIWVNEMNQIRQLISQVNSDRIDGQEALALAAQLRQQTIAGLNQIKTKSVRESRLTNQLRDLDNGVVAELKRAVERQATRQRIGPQLVPEFATGGRVPGIDQGFDSVIARLRPGEAVLNQSQIALLGGVSALRRARVPGFAEGGQITASTPSGGSNAGGPMTIIFEDVTIDAEGIFVKGARTSKGERVAVQIQRNARKNGRA